jgi:hypothetical protein
MKKTFHTNVVEKVKTHTLCFFNRAVCEILWKNIVEWGSPQMTVLHGAHISRSAPKATNTHSQYVILTAFPQQQWLRERASALS